MNAYYQYFLATGTGAGKTLTGETSPLAPTLDPSVPTNGGTTIGGTGGGSIDPVAPIGGDGGGTVAPPILEPSTDGSSSTTQQTNGAYTDAPTTKPVTNIYIQDGLLSGGSTMIPLPTAELETPIGGGIGGSGGGGGGGMPSMGSSGKGSAMLPFGKTIIPLVVIAAGAAILILKPLK